MAPLRICFFNRSYYPDLGATGQLLTELAEDLVRVYGCEIWVIAGPPLRLAAEEGADAGPVPARESRNGVEIIRARGTSASPRRFRGRVANYLTYFASAALAGLRVPRPDLVVFLTDPPIIGLAALPAAWWHGAGVVFVCKDVFPEVASVLEDFDSPTVNRVLDQISRLLIRRSSRVVAIGETMRQRLLDTKDAEPSRLAIIHDWADCAAIVPGPKRNAFSEAHGLADAFVVMHSGNLGLSQELGALLTAAGRLRAHGDIVITVIGDGASREVLQARARAERLDNVRFLPYQPTERLRHSFATADVFVISLKAGLAGYIVPSKLYGILAAGRPYVAAVDESSEVAAITRKHDCGLLAEPGNPVDLAEKLMMLYQDAELRRRLGANARQAALAFDRPAQVAAYHALFAEVAAGRPRGARRREPMLKRPFDVLLSGAGLLLSSPLWLLIAAAVKLEDGGPVFYAQERVGLGGRPFRSWKFRSMVADADARFGRRQARPADPRVTRMGRVLRAMALDELPQLWNIFRGDMSFVGPRALLPEETEVGRDGSPTPLDAIPGYEERQRVRPGLTGIAQVYARRDIPRRQKFRLDRLYIRRQSFPLDLRLIALSFWISARGKWEHRGRKI